MAESNDQLAQDMLELEQCRELLNVLKIMEINLNLINTGSGKTRTVMGGNLYAIAAEEYGDAAQWALIAKANNLTDPVLTGTINLIIPPLNGQDTAGILNA